MTEADPMAIELAFAEAHNRLIAAIADQLEALAGIPRQMDGPPQGKISSVLGGPG